ncbi:hypothetical protein LZ023_32500 [Pseudomonas silvicola]|nr:hypothetical protein LZ023_32500 [Pseudomonas silvicola]
MRWLVFVFLVVWIHLGDLGTAWLYHGGAWPQAGHLRNLRDVLAIAIAGLCLVSVRLPTRLLVPVLAYGILALAYLVLDRSATTSGILLGSFGTLLIPMLFFLVGFYCVRDPARLHRYGGLLATLAVASTLFGAWEQRHTGFWIDTLAFPQYMRDVKGLLVGANPDTGLPWNFYPDTEALGRRAAGLLAAPLAQGMFLAVAAITSIAWLERRSRWLGLALCALLFSGIWMSGTRGAMLAAGLALVGYMATSKTLFRDGASRLVLTLGALLAIGCASYGIVLVSINFLDGSTIGHWDALQKNIHDLPRVLLWGAGLGQQGAIAAQQSRATIGGGEGAIFSIAFQLGLPAALLFLWFYLNCTLALWRSYRLHHDPMALATFWLAIGVATTLISSEHVLAVSGTGAFWLLCGATLRSQRPLSPPAPEAAHEHP